MKKYTGTVRAAVILGAMLMLGTDGLYTLAADQAAIEAQAAAEAEAAQTAAEEQAAAEADDALSAGARHAAG